MKCQSGGRRVAIIGLGPRGLGAAEALAARAHETGRRFTLDGFDPGPTPGAGPNFCLGQTGICLLNTPLREIDIAAPEPLAARAVGFAGWFDPGATDPDQYPPRIDFGAYLADRFDSLVANASPVLGIRHRRDRIDALERRDGAWRLRSGEVWFGPYDEVLLAPGQPETETDPQIARWRAHAAEAGAELLSAYPDTRLLDAARRWSGRAVGIRGLGLTTFDILRVLTLGLGGRYEDGRYIPSGHEPARIIPFSLTGRPPAAKPETAEIDALFDPLEAETRAFEHALEQAVRAPAEDALDPIIEAVAAAATRMMRAMGAEAMGAEGSEARIRAWLDVERADPSAHEDAPPLALLEQEIAMAAGARAPSIGYGVGQLWRKWQNALRRGFNAADLDPAAAQAIIGFDEGLKRFSYGPPIESARQLAALAECGLVALRMADDPDIALTETGWRLVDGDETTLVTAMVDGVLPSPSLDGVQSPLIEDLKRRRRIAAIGDGLGARTRPDGQLVGGDGATQTGLSLLGRLATGSVIAVDSVHDCFGAAASRWADGVMARSVSAVPA